MATMSLVRAVGTTLAPAILVGLLANSLAGMSTTVMGQLPATITTPHLPTPPSCSRSSTTWPPIPGWPRLLLRTADVTTIVDRSATVAQRMFDEQKPQRVASIQEGVQKAITAVETQAAAMPDMPATAAAKAEMEKTAAQLRELSDAVPGAFDQARDDYVAEIRANSNQVEDTFQHELNMGFVNLFWFYGIACLLMLGLLAFIPSRKALNS